MIGPNILNSGSMQRSVYDPQNQGKISGVTVSTPSGGTLNMDSSRDHGGGSIDVSGGVGGDGGSVKTSNGGGNIDTTGTGSIQLGTFGTRTTLTGTATADRAITLPDAAGVVALQSYVDAAIAAILANPTTLASLMAAAGITPTADGTTTPVNSETTKLGIVTSLS
jgi:hypothetical protein